jgi:hypothetical protein
MGPPLPNPTTLAFFSETMDDLIDGYRFFTYNDDKSEEGSDD